MSKSRAQRCVLNCLTSFSTLMGSASCVVVSTSASILSCCSSRSFQILKYAQNIYCLARLEKCLILFVVNTLSVDMHALSHHRPEVLFTLFPLQRNPTVKILGATPRILDSLSCNLSPLLPHLLFHETASSAGLCVHLCILSS